MPAKAVDYFPAAPAPQDLAFSPKMRAPVLPKSGEKWYESAPQPGIFSGPGAGHACYDERNIRGSLFMPQFHLKACPEVFQIFQTRRGIIRKE